MPNLQARLKKAVTKAAGSVFWKKFTLTSSSITTTAQDLTSATTGDLAITEVILATDSTGLAGGTNFQLTAYGEIYGPNTLFVEAVANLGASALRSLNAGSDDSTNDRFLSVTGAKAVLQAGDKIQYDSTVAACTGAGKVAIFIKFERIDENADIASAV